MGHQNSCSHLDLHQVDRLADNVIVTWTDSPAGYPGKEVPQLSAIRSLALSKGIEKYCTQVSLAKSKNSN